MFLFDEIGCNELLNLINNGLNEIGLKSSRLACFTGLALGSKIDGLQLLDQDLASHRLSEYVGYLMLAR